MATGSVIPNEFKHIGLIYTGTPLSIDLSKYKTLILTPMINGIVPYGSTIVSVDAITNAPWLVYVALYQDSSYSMNCYVAANSPSFNQLSLTVAAIRGWRSVAMNVYAI